MKESQQKAAAKEFAKYWENKGYEKGESQPFWLSLLRDVLGVEHPEQYISFEDKVMLDHTSFIDGKISATHVLIEQKSKNKDLRKGIKQSDGTLLNPFQQAKRYSAELPYSERPRWIVTCNFNEFLIYDMENPTGEPDSILLKDLPKEYYRLKFLVNTESEFLKQEMEISIKAGEIVGVLYDKLLAQYKEPDENSLKSLNALCVRLVFCLYAEDAEIFSHMLFHDYLKDIPVSGMRKALAELFKILDTKECDRDKYLPDDNPKLAAFPYVNGGLFADETIEIPPFTEELKDLLLRKASEDFDWSGISPTIFGAVFESTLNPQTRRSGGMHYTSIENIHKVIDPLFLDDLKKEFEEIKEIKIEKNKKAKIETFRKKLASLKFLDPACGSGNFLTETYICLRHLENKAIAETTNQISLADVNPIEVSIGQFYGIEINDFAVTVAKTALWIAESQTMKETEEILHMDIDFLPLKSYANIVEGNALQIDWETVVPKNELNYIMGNPPFVGKKEQSKEQKSDIISIFGKDVQGVGNLDYVSGWYMKAVRYIENSNIFCAFVSTNSITQGEQTAILWKPLINSGISINFAYQTFKWASEAKDKAAVHCVIIGFSYINKPQKYLYNNSGVHKVNNINAYLIDAPNIFVTARKTPLFNVPEIVTGNQSTDDGYFYISQDEYNEFIKSEPKAKKFIKRAYNSQGFINGKYQYCLWLVGISPYELREMPIVKERVENIRQFRLKSTKKATQEQANIPTLFTEIRQPDSNYIVVPKVSSENRRYIPLGFLTPDIICNNTIKLIPNATLYHFGVLCSNVHNAWMRAVAGRLKSDYQYSNTIVYNNFVWCKATENQKSKIEQTAQTILDARALYPDSSLADLYDETAMPPELRKAHQANDRAVMQAYGFDVKTMTESECVAELMKMYVELTK
jgi:hypothetical protein